MKIDFPLDHCDDFVTQVPPPDGGGGNDPNIVQYEWDFVVNTTYPTTGTLLGDSQQLLFGVKQTMVGNIAGLTTTWVVVGSSDGTTAGLDGVDRWAAPANLIWGILANPRSWIVLGNDAINPGFQLLLVLDRGTNDSISVYMSATNGFTGGATNARPTATDEISLLTGNYGVQSAPTTNYTHILQTKDGTCFRCFFCSSGQGKGMWTIERPVYPRTGFTIPVAAWVRGSNASEVLNNTNLFSSFLGQMATPPLSNTQFYLQGANSLYPTLYSNPNSLDNSWDLYPCGYSAQNSGGNGGRIGICRDLYAGSVGRGTGDTYPGDGSNQLAQFGFMCIPWPGGAAPLTGGAPGTPADARVERMYELTF